LVGGFRSGNITTNLANSGAGWNLIANPYPSNINVSSTSISTGWSNVQPSVFMYDKKNKSFISYNRTNGANTGKMTGIIPMGGAFLVQADGAVNSEASITFTESMKTETDASAVAINPFFLTIDSLKNRFGISIKNENMKSQKEEDECVFLFGNDENSTDNYDSQFDAVDLKSEVVNIGVFSKDKIKLSISSYPNILENYVKSKFPLTVWAKDTGSFSIFYNNIASLDSNMEMWLKDNYLNKILKC
jgi:hypothetical protein